MASQGRLSPDGKKIAFLVVSQILDEAPGKVLLTGFRLHVRDVDGKGLGTELGSAKVFAWSPDGTEIVASDFTATEGLPDKIEPAATHFVADVRTGKKTALNLPNDHIISDWSRDGKHLVTTRLRGTKDAPSARVYLMNRDGTEHKAVTDDKGLAMAGKLSPDGRRVLYMKIELPKDKALTRTLVVADLAAGTATPVGGIPQDADVQDYCWSPDGKRIAYTWRRTINAGTTQEETEAAVVICAPDGTKDKEVLTDKHPTNTGTLMHVDWR
jgi:Tol biopolymer transport system component